MRPSPNPDPNPPRKPKKVKPPRKKRILKDIYEDFSRDDEAKGIETIDVPELRSERTSISEKQMFLTEMRIMRHMDITWALMGQVDKKKRSALTDAAARRLTSESNSAARALDSLARTRLAQAAYYKEPPALLPAVAASTTSEAAMPERSEYRPGNPSPDQWQAKARQGQTINLNVIPPEGPQQ